MRRLRSDPSPSSTSAAASTSAMAMATATATATAVTIRASAVADSAAVTSPTDAYRHGHSCSSTSSHAIRHSSHSLGFRSVYHSSMSDAATPSSNPTRASGTGPGLPRKHGGGGGGGGARNLFEKIFRLNRKRANLPPPSCPHPSSNTNGHGMHAQNHTTTPFQSTRQRNDQIQYARVVVMEGMLTILSAHHKYWQKKPTYFELACVDTHWTLFQYRERGDSLPLSVFRLSQHDKVSEITAKVNKPALELNTRDRFRPLRLLATDQKTLQSWIDALLLAIKKCSHPDSPMSAERFVARDSLPSRMAAMEVSSGSTKSHGLGACIGPKSEERRLPESDLMSKKTNPFCSGKCGKTRTVCRCDPQEQEEKATSTSTQCRSIERRSSGANHSTKSSNSNSTINNNYEEDEDNQHHELRGSDGSVEGGRSLSASLSPEENFSRFISSPNQPRDSMDNQSCSEGKQWTSGSATSGATADVVSVERSSASSSSSGIASAMDRPLANPKLRSGYPNATARTNVHSFNANGQIFTLDVRYRLIKSIGTGAYGAVIAAKDSRVDQSVAIKKITNIFDDLVDAKRILREVRLLHHFHHKNITKLLDLPAPLSRRNFEDMYIITELMETDLHQVIYSMQPMSDDHIKYFLYQTLCALHHIHSAGVLHRDIKPSNILLNSNCDLKICDFGLARGGVPETTELTEYVVTRWYRAPEIMLNCLNYTAAVDVWAVGCIFAEMILREPLFPGNDYIHQLKLIIRFLGTPKQEDIEFVKNNKALRFLTRLPISKPKKFQEHFAETNDMALDLLQRMLVFNPAKRISVWDALHHPYLSSFYEEKDISSCLKFDFTFDLPDDKLTKEALMELLMQDIEQFHPNQKLSMVHPTTSYRGAGGASANAASSSSTIHRPFGVSASAS